MIEKRLDISLPLGWAPTLESGKLLPSASVALTLVTLEDGVPLGQGTNHMVAVEMQQDGTWGFQVEPILPPGFPPLTNEQRARIFSIFAQHAAHYGIIDHVLPDGRKVTYEKGDDDLFVRNVAAKGQ